MSIIREHFFQHIAQTSSAPQGIEIEHGEGIYLYDTSGRKYTDLISGISVSSLGHSNPFIIEAIQRQAEKYLHTMVYGEHILKPQVEFAKLLCQQLPDQLNNVFFVNSGSEAVEGAMKLSKRYTGRYEIVSCKNAYHGSSHGAQSLMNNEYFSSSFRPFLPGIRFIEYNQIESLELITEKTAAVFVETIQGEAGIQVASLEFMLALADQCHRKGALLIFDEIQCGFGRTGKLFAFEHYGVEPDILLVAKAMGTGMPIGAFLCNDKIMKSLVDNPVLGHISTFGGHPVSAAAGLAGLKYLLENDLMGSVPEKADMFAKQLQHPKVKGIRYKGLMMAFDVGSKENMKKIVQFSQNNNILIDWFLYNEHCFRIAPPLIISKEQILETCHILKKGLDQL